MPTQLIDFELNTDFKVQYKSDSPFRLISNLFFPAFILLPLPAAGINKCTITFLIF